MNIRTSISVLASVILLLSASMKSTAQQYMPAEKGCKVEFKVAKHKGEQVVRGTFSNLKGKIAFDPQHLNTASFDITIGAGSINTGIPEVDKDLKKEHFFNLPKYALITIKSTSVTQDRPGGIVYVLHGNLTIKGITKPVNIQFMATPMDAGYLFRGTLTVSRLAFNLGNKEDGIDDNVSVFIEVRANKK